MSEFPKFLIPSDIHPNTLFTVLLIELKTVETLPPMLSHALFHELGALDAKLRTALFISEYLVLTLLAIAFAAVMAFVLMLSHDVRVLSPAAFQAVTILFLATSAELLTFALMLSQDVFMLLETVPNVVLELVLICSHLEPTFCLTVSHV